MPSLLEESLAQAADALIRAERVGDPVQHYWASQCRYGAANVAGDVLNHARIVAAASRYANIERLATAALQHLD